MTKRLSIPKDRGIVNITADGRGEPLEWNVRKTAQFVIFELQGASTSVVLPMSPDQARRAARKMLRTADEVDPPEKILQKRARKATKAAKAGKPRRKP